MTKTSYSHLKTSLAITVLCLSSQAASNTTEQDMALFFNKSKPLDIKTPLMLLEKKQSGALGRYNIGADANMMIGYDETYDNKHATKTQLTAFSLKFTYLLNDWTSMNGKIFLDTSSFPSAIASPPNFVNRLSNSRMALTDGYVMFGNLDLSPVYSYWGQTGLPYGKNYSPSNATNLSERMQQVSQRTVALGALQDMGGVSFNPEVFLFNGDSKPISNLDVPTYGINLISASSVAGISWEFQGGWLSNIADSNGFQRTVSTIPGAGIGSVFDYGDDYTQLRTVSTSVTNKFTASGGFATSKTFEAIQHRVPGGSVALKINVPYDVTLSTAYSSALENFDYRDLTYRDTGVMFSDSAPTSAEGAHPSAWNAYVEKKMSNNIDVYTGIESTNQSLALSVPKSRWILGITKKWDAFTKIILEVKQDTNYATSTDALGPCRSDVDSSNAVHLDGDSALHAYALAPTTYASNGLNTRGKTATDIILTVKVKF